MQLDMTRGPILPRMIRFMIPILIGNIFQQLYNMVDTMIVGKFLGASALAAVGSTGNLMFMVTGFAMGTAIGFSVLTSQSFGAGREDRLKTAVAGGVILALILSAVLTAGSLLGAEGALRLMRTPADIFPEAKAYITIIFAGLTATFFYNLLSSHLRAVGNSRAPLVFLILSAVLNVFLDLFLIAVLGFGVRGAAFATVLSQGLSALMCLVYILKRMPILVPGRAHWRLRKEIAMAQLKMGLPMGLQHTITASGMVVMQAAINSFGSVAVASITAAMKLQYLLMQGCTSIGHTMTPFCGQNMGKGDYRRLREGFRTAVLMEIVFSIFAALILIFVLPKLLFLFFRTGTDMTEIIRLAKPYLYITSAFYFPLSLIFIFRNGLQGCGYAMVPMFSGVVELVARVIVALLSIHLGSYILAVSCDPAAWLCAGLYGAGAYLLIRRKWPDGSKRTVPIDSQ